MSWRAWYITDRAPWLQTTPSVNYSLHPLKLNGLICIPLGCFLQGATTANQRPPSSSILCILQLNKASCESGSNPTCCETDRSDLHFKAGNAHVQRQGWKGASACHVSNRQWCWSISELSISQKLACMSNFLETELPELSSFKNPLSQAFLKFISSTFIHMECIVSN